MRKPRRYNATYYLDKQHLGTNRFSKRQLNADGFSVEQLLVTQARSRGLTVTGSIHSQQLNDTTVRYTAKVTRGGQQHTFILDWS